MERNVFFTSDLHFGHAKIIKHCPSRLCFFEHEGLSDDEIVANHDRWLMDKWNSTVSKHDEVFIIGDMSFHNRERTEKLLHKLKGRKHLIIGNHDKSSSKCHNNFVTMGDIREYRFKKNVYEKLLDEDMNVVMCHYPMLTWNGKNEGTFMLHGHCHGRIDSFNESQNDLRVDVGLDGKLSQYELIPFERLCEHFRKKTEGFENVKEYIRHFYPSKEAMKCHYPIRWMENGSDELYEISVKKLDIKEKDLEN